MNRKEEIEMLEKILAELKSQPDFEVGKWYKAKSHDAYFCYKGNRVGYGTRINNVWIDDEPMTEISLWTEATQEEVEAALIEEAERRGFKEGVRIKSLQGTNDLRDQSILRFVWYKNLGVALYANNGSLEIFREGKWAEIIEEPKVVIGGQEVKKSEFGFKIGCTTIESPDLVHMTRLAKEYNLKSITHNEIGEIKIEQLNQILSLKK